MGNKVSLKPGIPSVKAQDEDLVDPQQTLRYFLRKSPNTLMTVKPAEVVDCMHSMNVKILCEECHELPKCTALHEKYTACNDRVNSRKKTAEICSEELFDYLHCVDACVSKTLFSHLK